MIEIVFLFYYYFPYYFLSIYYCWCYAFVYFHDVWWLLNFCLCWEIIGCSFFLLICLLFIWFAIFRCLGNWDKFDVCITMLWLCTLAISNSFIACMFTNFHGFDCYKYFFTSFFFNFCKDIYSVFIYKEKELNWYNN